MGRIGKKYRAAAERIDRGRIYEPTEALELVRSAAYAKFDESVEVAVMAVVGQAREPRRGIVVTTGCEQAVDQLARGARGEALARDLRPNTFGVARP